MHEFNERVMGRVASGNARSCMGSSTSTSSSLYSSTMLNKMHENAKNKSTEKLVICDQLLNEVQSAIYWVDYNSRQIRQWQQRDRSIPNSALKKMKKKRDKLMKVAREYENRREWPILRNSAGDYYNEGLVQQEEIRYCYCNRISFGHMIGCENENCEFGGWFHFPCVGIYKEPKEEESYYCPTCKFRLVDREYRVMARREGADG